MALMHDAPLPVPAKLTKGAVPYDVCHRALLRRALSPSLATVRYPPIHVTPDRPWMWANGHGADTVHRAAHGYEPTREEAMAAFAKSWSRTFPL